MPRTGPSDRHGHPTAQPDDASEPAAPKPGSGVRVRTPLPGSRAWIPFAAVPVLATWMSTVRTRWLGAEHLAAARARCGPVIVAMWHEHLLQFAWTHRHQGAQVLISRHGDGELIARIVERLGYRTARGSSTRGGSTALLDMVHTCRTHGCDLGITPDGPRGPRRQVQMGTVTLAAATGLPIVPLALGHARFCRAGSWDRMVLPWPGTRAVVLAGEPLEVPAGASPEALEASRAQLEQSMCTLATRAVEDLPQLYRAGGSQRTFDPHRGPRT